MTRPARLQLSRRARFNLQAVSLALNGLPAISCARPGPHGNPFRIGQYAFLGDPDRPSGPLRMSYAIAAEPRPRFTLIETAEQAVEFFERYAAGWSPEYLARKRSELVGRNLACWCGLGDLCHVDPLLRLVNPETPDEA